MRYGTENTFPLPLWERVAPKAPGEGFVPQTPNHRPTSKRIRDFAKGMRREPTDAEAAMWRLLRDRRLAAFKFRRQHASSDRDATRDAVLAAQGFQTARYWNNDVLQRPIAVLEDILAKLFVP